MIILALIVKFYYFLQVCVIGYAIVLWQGDIYNHESLVKAIKQVDVVISTVGASQVSDQDRIIAAIKEAGNVKVTIRFISELTN